MTEKQQAYQNILSYCKGYEENHIETSKDYDRLKKLIEELKEEASH